MQPKHILVLDHEGEIREVVSALLVDLGYRVSVASDAEAMRALPDSESIDLIVLDASASDGQASISRLRRRTRASVW
jgi:DNA-binding response OmpR family regulator